MVLLALAIGAVGANMVAARRGSSAAESPFVPLDRELARAAMRDHGCAACHSIPGVPGANGRVGPPLSGMGARVYIAGILPNTPDNMVRWLLDPPAADPRTAMPVTGVSEDEARHIAAYLSTL